MRKMFLLSLLAVGAGCLGAADFFAIPADGGADLSPDKVYPQGRLFPFSVFQPKSLKETKDAFFTMAGPGYGPRIQSLTKEACELKMPMIYTIHANYNGKPLLKAQFDAKGVSLDWEQIRSDIERQVKTALASGVDVGWWYLQPEELRFWRKDEIKYLKVAYETIRAADPLKRPVWMYNPNHYDIEGLKKYTGLMDIMGKGMYANYSGNKSSRVWCRWSSENQVKAIEATGAKSFAICVPEMFEEPAAGSMDKIESWVRHDVYLSLICGSKGVVVFSLATRPTLSADAHSRYYAAYKQVARELNGPVGLGQVFLFGKRCNDLHGKVISGPAEVSITPLPRKPDVFKYPSVTFADVSYKTGRYFLAVNSAEEPVGYELSGFPPEAVKFTDVVSGKELTVARGGLLKLDFRPLEVKLLRMTPNLQ